jgi:hypothetical protein
MAASVTRTRRKHQADNRILFFSQCNEHVPGNQPDKREIYM